MGDNKLRCGENNDYLRHAAQHTYYVHFGLFVSFVFNSARVNKSEGHLTGHAHRQKRLGMKKKERSKYCVPHTIFTKYIFGNPNPKFNNSFVRITSFASSFVLCIYRK